MMDHHVSDRLQGLGSLVTSCLRQVTCQSESRATCQTLIRVLVIQELEIVYRQTNLSWLAAGIT